jgi:tetratricopeptide (TPR) repeat protein
VCPDANLLNAFFEGRLTGAALDELERHLDGCVVCRQLVAAVGAAMPSTEVAGAELMRGELFGRYMLVERIGAGAMGTVYAAYDPELDRKVALKLVREVDAPEASQRLAGEARLAARLQHPNIVVVHDVGALDAQVFVAMELVDGATLSAWLKDGPRTRTEILGVFLQAARGLAAAHAAGIVHRDFKPSNVLVGKDGRVRVADFGLARAVADVGPAGVAGSPAYMSPEQHRGEPADVRADQFAFCVALYEALYGARPFDGEEATQLRESVVAGRVREAPAGAAVPAWLRRVVLRGLSVAPERRFASMDELIVALEQTPRARRRRVWALAGLVVIAGTATGIGVRRQRLMASCHAGAERLREPAGAAHRARVAAAFLATHAPFADAARSSVERVLTAYADEIAAIRESACVERDAFGDARIACADERGRELAALVGELEHADRSVVMRAVDAVHGLGDPRRCREARWLAREESPPAGPLGDRLAAAQALDHVGHYAESRDAAEAVARDARANGDRRTEVAAQLLTGQLDAHLRHSDAALQSLHATAWLAESAGRDGDAALAWDELAYVLGFQLHRADEARQALALAHAKLLRIGDDPLLTAHLAQTEGAVLEAEGRMREAEQALRKALAIKEQLYGPTHPLIGGTIVHLSNVVNAQDRLDESLQLDERVLAIREAAFGAEHPMLVSSLVNLGSTLTSAGRYDDARRRLERARDIGERSFGSDDAALINVHSNLGNVEALSNRPDAALAEYRRALAIAIARDGEGSADAADMHLAVGEMLSRKGNNQEALAEMRRALAVQERVLGAEHPRLSMTLRGIADCLRELGQVSEALPLAERALRIHLAHEGDPSEGAAIRFSLAQVLWGRDRARARSLAVEAQKSAREAARREIDDWLAKRR